jgi:hypothetical protein
MADRMIKMFKSNKEGNKPHKHFDILLRKGQEYQRKTDYVKEAKKSKELEGCSFKPAIS